MTDIERPKRGRGRPKVYGKRQNFAFRVTEETRARLIESAQQNGRSLSEEIEFRINRDFGWETSQTDIEAIKHRALLWEDASRVKAIRAAGLTILREIDGKPTRVIVDLDRLLSEAEGMTYGLRAGFIDATAPPPAAAAPRAMTQQEADRALAELDAIKRQIEAARARMAAEHAADDTERQ